jgi:hypothetical protein
VKLAFVHLSNDEAKAQKYFALSRLDDAPRIADPEGHLYQAFGLVRANWRQFFNAESLTRMVMAWLDGHWVGARAGDVERMPGVFLMANGEIRKAFRHKLISDRPDYLGLASLA